MSENGSNWCLVRYHSERVEVLVKQMLGMFANVIAPGLKGIRMLSLTICHNYAPVGHISTLSRPTSGPGSLSGSGGLRRPRCHFRLPTVLMIVMFGSTTRSSPGSTCARSHRSLTSLSTRNNKRDIRLSCDCSSDPILCLYGVLESSEFLFSMEV